MSQIISEHQIKSLHRLNKLELRKKINSVNVANKKLTETLSAKDNDIKELSEALMDAANNMISNKLMDKYLAIANKFLI